MHIFKMFWDTIGAQRGTRTSRGGQGGYWEHEEVLGHHGGGPGHHGEQGERLVHDRFFRLNYEKLDTWWGTTEGYWAKFGCPVRYYMDITEGSRAKLGFQWGTWTLPRAPGPCWGSRLGTWILQRATGPSWSARCGIVTSWRGADHAGVHRAT
jgi:hypothetical protein